MPYVQDYQTSGKYDAATGQTIQADAGTGMPGDGEDKAYEYSQLKYGDSVAVGSQAWKDAQQRYQGLQNGQDSYAEAMARAKLGQATQAMSAQAVSRGANPLAERAAIMGGGQAMRMGMVEASALRAQEMGQAQQQFQQAAIQRQAMQQQWAAMELQRQQAEASSYYADRGADVAEQQADQQTAAGYMSMGSSMVGAAAGGMASDRRVKMDVQPAGADAGGGFASAMTALGANLAKVAGPGNQTQLPAFGASASVPGASLNRATFLGNVGDAGPSNRLPAGGYDMRPLGPMTYGLGGGGQSHARPDFTDAGALEAPTMSRNYVPQEYQPLARDNRGQVLPNQVGGSFGYGSGANRHGGLGGMLSDVNAKRGIFPAGGMMSDERLKEDIALAGGDPAKVLAAEAMYRARSGLGGGYATSRQADPGSSRRAAPTSADAERSAQGMYRGAVPSVGFGYDGTELPPQQEFPRVGFGYDGAGNNAIGDKFDRRDARVQAGGEAYRRANPTLGEQIRQKVEAAKAAAEQDALTRNLDLYQYRYRPGYERGSGLPEGQKGRERVGVMAQDLAASPIGAHAVNQTPKGLAIDAPQAIGLSLGLAGRLGDRADQTEERIARLEAMLAARGGR